VPAAVAQPSPKGTLDKLPFAVVANVAPIVPDVTAVMPNVAAVSTQVAFVLVNVAPLVAGGRVIPVPHVFAQLSAVLPDVALVRSNVSSVLAPVNSVLSKVSPVAAQVAILAQRKRRSQHCKHQQSNDSSSHIASLVSGPLGLCDLEHRDIKKVLRQVSVWKGRRIRPSVPGRPQ